MAGTGSGMLQPTKLVQNDDFMPGLALPGYIQRDLITIATAATLKMSNYGDNHWFVPDGMTVEVVDFGVTATTVAIVDTLTTTTSTVALNAIETGGTTAVVAAAFVTGGAGATTTLALGASASILRASAEYVFTAASIAKGNKYGPGTKFEVAVADVSGSGATGVGSVWIRLKFASNDARAI
tara:strand:+ start:2353 stop:2898 length:546 start_codon:yes stop_codon:yes gene_type:complete